MRNNVQLFIGGKRADLDDGSFLLLNYTAEDLSNPTIVRNSFSRQITLKGTPTNDEIFGHIYRNDRLTQYGGGSVGPDFDPTRKTPFTIYNEMGEILEDGYLKLNKVVRKGRTKEYAVTLYGGLGSFLYGLAYDNAGNKRTLADLDFGQTLDFTINRTAVADAWARIGGDTSKAAKWDIINFTPAYGGLPAGEFDANKAIIHAETAGLNPTDGGFSTMRGFTLATLAEKVTGNEAGDFRSYLQKPVLNMAAVINAVCNPANNGGYTVNLDPDFFVNTNPYWAKTWLTLPLLTELNLDIVSDSGDFTPISAPYTYAIPSGGNLTTAYSVNFKICPDFGFTGGVSGQYVLHCEDDWAAGMPGDESPGFYLNYFEFTLTMYDSGDNVMDAVTFRVSTAQPPSNYPQMDFLLDYIDAATGDGYKDGELFTFPVSMIQYGAAKVKIEMAVKGIAWGHLNGVVSPDKAWPVGSYRVSDGQSVTIGYVRAETLFHWQSISSSTARTGASITQSALLNTGHTPADYLLSFCKTFGLYLVTRKGEKVVDIVMRKNFYNGTKTDLSGRIDRGREIEKVPFAFDAMWYVFRNETIPSEFIEYYANKYGKKYGSFRVNTGYEFDASEKVLTEGIVFKDAPEVLETSKYFCAVTYNGRSVPAVLLGGGKYTLYKGGGETKDLDIAIPPTALRTWLNAYHPMHDEGTKVQIHGGENKALDERDTLLFFNGMQTPTARLSLTDDTRDMLSLNGNTPCWMPGYCEYDGAALLSSLPAFGRYIIGGGTITESLDFGDPLEVEIPGVSVGPGSSVFERYWEKYIGDRYDDDSAVVTAYVDLRGMKVDENLLRQFYAFDGAVWALNRIIDYSLTTFGPTKCEFVKVQDITNYTTL